MSKNNIKLYFDKFKSESYNYSNGESALIFVTDPWDDGYRYETLFHVYFSAADKITYYVGSVKIYTTKGNITRNEIELNNYFECLDNTFYSLGQSIDYYKRLKEHLKDSYKDTLSKLRDIAINSELLDELKEKYWDAYSTSLTRDSTASSALKIINQEMNTYHSFIFENIIKEGITQRCDFDFSKNENLPYRINAIIGKNATGKTTFLSSLAEHLHSRENFKSEFCKLIPLEQRHRDTIKERDYLEYLGFTNYITVSFNAFDDFYQPNKQEIETLISLVNQLKYYYTFNKKEIINLMEKNEKNEKYKEYVQFADEISNSKSLTNLIYMSSDIKSYKYIGLRKHNIINTDYYLYNEMLNSLRMIYIQDYYVRGDMQCKLDILKMFVLEVLYYEDERQAINFYNDIEKIHDKIGETYSSNSGSISFEDSFIQDIERIIKQMSSGQNITFYIYLNIIANITESSLLLIDEPETHLHPNAISVFISFLYNLLEQYKSYAIMTTHSPLVIQEIPSSHISIFKNIDGNHHANKITMETFGANISDVIYDVFYVNEDESNYQKNLLDLYNKGMKYDEIVSLFKNNLNIDTKLFLKNLYNKHGE